MKRFLLVCCLLAASACTKDQTENANNPTDPQKGAVVIGNPALAATGTIAVKLVPEAVAALTSSVTRGEVVTRSGIEGIDAVLDEIGVSGFERVFVCDAEWADFFSEMELDRWYTLSFDDGESLEKVGALLAERSEIAVVEYAINPKYRRRMSEGPARPFFSASAHTPATSTRAASPMNDPVLKYQWHYENTGPMQNFPQPKAGSDINLFDAWSLCTGNSQVVVAVIDEPVQTTHPDLADNIWTNPANPKEHGYNFWNQSATLDWKSAEYDVDYGWAYADHGSHVAGVIAAVNNNGKGVCGIAGGNGGNGVKIMSCQIMGYSNKTTDNYADSKAFTYALTNGAVVAQNSWGYDMTESRWNTNDKQLSMLRDAIQAFAKGAGSKNAGSPIKGGLVFFAAGNDGLSNKGGKTWPSAYEHVIAVGAMAWDFLPAYYTDYGTWVDISAPGGDAYSAKASNTGRYESTGQILSTILCDDAIDFKDGRKGDSMYGYGYMQGTSMACPHVSGVAALGLAYAAQLGKQFTVEEYTALLLSSVYGVDKYFTGTKIGDNGTQSVTVQLSNYRGKMGGGSIDALKLLLAIKGTPAVYVKTGEAATVDFATYFGGADTKVALISASSSDLTSIGLSSLPAFAGTKMTVNCGKSGVAMITIKAKAGDKEFSREFALVSRAGLAENGGWL